MVKGKDLITRNKTKDPSVTNRDGRPRLCGRREEVVVDLVAHDCSIFDCFRSCLLLCQRY